MSRLWRGEWACSRTTSSIVHPSRCPRTRTGGCPSSEARSSSSSPSPSKSTSSCPRTIAWARVCTGCTSMRRCFPQYTIQIGWMSSSVATRKTVRRSRAWAASFSRGNGSALDPELPLLLIQALLVRGREVVVRELLDALQVLHEHLFRRRREEAVELTILPDCVEEVPSAHDESEETEDPDPEDVFPDACINGSEPVRALHQENVAPEREEHPEDAETENQGTQLVPELPEHAHAPPLC